MKHCMHNECKKPLEAGAIVWTREDRDGAVCSMACAGAFDKKHVKQTELIPKWIEKKVVAQCFRAEACTIPKVSVAMKGGKKIPQVTMNLPGTASVDQVTSFTGQTVEVEISRVYLEKIKKSPAKGKAAAEKAK